MVTGSTVIPTIRYRDALAMIDWLCSTFGFDRFAIHEDGKGGVAHAQLALNGGMIMLGSARDDEFGSVQKPTSPGESVTQSAYVVVEDPDAIYQKAKDAKAEIVLEIADQDYGGRLFSCRDPEGQLWNIGSYNPWNSRNGT